MYPKLFAQEEAYEILRERNAALLKLLEVYREIHKDLHIRKSLEEKRLDAEYTYEKTIKRQS
jgi:hypothetical protein